MGKIFNIQKFCTHDGPGIRTSVFFKGCPLKCAWCHNPESLDIMPTAAYYSAKCVKCGKCLSACRNQGINPSDFHFIKENCILCGKCIDICPVSARVVHGYKTGAEDVIKEILKDKEFYDRSGGGVTFTGGEPTYQKDFLLELAKKSKEKDISVAVETNFYVSGDYLEKLSPYTDLFLTDIKIIEDEKHIKYCGVSNKIILENIRFVSDVLKKNMLFRVPLIPDINDREKDLEMLADFVLSLKEKHKVQIMNYHDIGISKYDACGMDYSLKDTKPAENTDKAEKYLENRGVEIAKD